MPSTAYAYRAELPMPFDEAVERTVHELGERGFGVITWIDVKDKLKERLGVAFRPYIIMGVTDPSSALSALEANLDAGLVLTCHVIVYAIEPGRSMVAALAPEVAISILGGDEKLETLAREAGSRIEAAIDALNEKD